MFARLLLSLGLILSLSGCDQPAEPDRIRFGIASAPLNLDPRFATDATSERINRLLYQRLIDFDARGMPVPGIASWQQLSPHHYRFTLLSPRPRFSDGATLSAADVAATYRFVLDLENGSPHRSALALIEQIAVVDQETIDFHLARADALFPAYLVLGILPKRLIQSAHDFHQQPLGSGPFRFLAHPGPGQLLLERRSDGQRIELVEVKNPTVRLLKLLRGEIDLLQNDLSPELLGLLREEREVQVDARPGSNFSYIGLNLADPLTGNPLIRQALAHGIDRAAIIQHLFRGDARPAEAIFPPEHWAGAAELPPYVYDPERARALLREAGFGPDRPLRLSYKTSSDPFRLRLAAILQSQLRHIGVEIEIHSYDWGTFFGDIKAGRFQLYSLSWVGVRTPDIFRYIFASDSLPPGGANRGRYASPEVDRLIDQAEGTENLQQRALRYRQIEQILHRDLPYIPLWYEHQYSASAERLEGYRLMADGNYDGLQNVVLNLEQRERQ